MTEPGLEGGPGTQAGGLRLKAASAVKWTALSSLVTSVMAFGQLAVLGRVLTQADFGLMAMVAVVMGLAYVFADAGLSNAVIYRQSTSDRQLSSLFWINLATGVTIFGVLSLISPLVARFYHEPGVGGLLRLASVSFLLIPFGQLPQALMQKRLAFRRLAVIEMSASTLGLVTAVATALAGQGVLSFVWGQLAAQGSRAFGMLVVSWPTWRPRVAFSPSGLGSYLSFGLFQTGERTLNYLASNVDYILVGRLLGPRPLGQYTVAYQMCIMPVARINPILTRVAFPTLALRQKDPDAMQRGYFELVKAAAFISLPLVLGLAASAPAAVPVLIGEQWTSSVPIVQLLALMAAVRVLGNTSGSLLLAKGRADIGFWWNVFTVVTTAIVLYAVVRSGVVAVAAAQLGLNIVLFCALLMVLRRWVALDPSGFARAALKPVLASFAMGAVVWLLCTVLMGAGLSAAASLVVVIAAGACVYLLAWRLLERDYVRSTWHLLVRRRPEGSA